MSTVKLETLTLLERKEYEELKLQSGSEANGKKDRAVFLGFFVISLISTLMISGALKFG